MSLKKFENKIQNFYFSDKSWTQKCILFCWMMTSGLIAEGGEMLVEGKGAFSEGNP